MQKGSVIIMIILIILSVDCFSDEEAITSSGKRVLLKDDGTWTSVLIKLSESKTDFRNTKWGMTQEEVITAEKIEKKDISSQTKNLLGINTTVSSYPSLVYYIFAYNRLVRAVYAFQIEHTNKTEYIDIDYKNVKEMITNKYGIPKSDDKLWKNNLYKDDPTNWGLAVSMGHLTFSTLWANEKTNVVEFLSGDNFDIKFGVGYSSIEYSGLEKKEKTEASKNNF
jgi:hypothetical protein